MITEQAEVTIFSTTQAFKTKLKVLIVPKITNNLPAETISTFSFNIPCNIILADPNFNKSTEIDLLLGAEIFYELLGRQQIKPSKTGPIFTETALGWIVSGKLTEKQSNEELHQSVCHVTLDRQMEKFWKVEEIHERRNFSKEEEECEIHFKNNHERDLDGHFVVKLPFKTNKEKIGESYSIALKRFQTQEQRLVKNEKLFADYRKFMNEYQELGHMSLINKVPVKHYFLPHHAVIKKDSLTTKLRVVFDGSAATTTGVSLNQTLKKGPIIQDELFQILLRFRLHNIVLTADIVKMYRQVKVAEEDRDFQLILWRDRPSDEIQIFKLHTVTYGTTSAPFLAVRCINQIADEQRVNYPNASNILENDFYVDDLLTGFQTQQEACQVASEVSHILKTGNFELRKWRSNSPEVLNQLSNEFTKFNVSDNALILDSDTAIKTLGLHWNTKQDTFEYTFIQPHRDEVVSKRNILSAIAKIYDPLGLLGPLITIAKVIMQEVWKCNISWDDPLPHNILQRWTNFIESIKKLHELHIPRKISDFEIYTSIELHGFCDASQVAYGACMYVLTTDKYEKRSAYLLCSKSRVAPIKPITLPRLELCGAVLLSQLLQKVLSSFATSFDKITLWTDSTIVLAWISTSPALCKTFICNRISEIQKKTSSDMWRHIPGSQNPADLISRGKSASELLNNSMWWNGPSWLLLHETSWPKPNSKESDAYTDDILEKKGISTLTHTTLKQSSIFDRYSSFVTLQRITAWCLRFRNNTLRKEERQLDYLSTKELYSAIKCLVKLAQQPQYMQEINSLKREGKIHTSSNILSLNPFLDEDGILRVGGRLQHANIPQSQKHPFLLPAKHPLTTLIIRFEHERLLHAGPQSTLCNLRQQYWIPSGKNVVKKTIRSCITCFKAAPKRESQIMGNLPATRVNEAKPFEITGVDFGGPMLIKDSHRRGRPHTTKCYIAVFVCFVTKAIHLELVSNLSTDAFMAALRRFISRRGWCKHIYSDNATNFKGAKNELYRFYEFISRNKNTDLIAKQLSTAGLTWHFIPPRSPHFGGLWEAAVKTVKYHIKRVISNTILTFEEYYTVLTQIEMSVNSRPITPMSNDISDLNALTPNHFLVGGSFTGYDEQDFTQVSSTAPLSRWKNLQKLNQDIFKRWKKEYLSSLQHRTRWKTRRESLKLGDLVLVLDESTNTWPLGRIIEVHAGDDNIVRVVSVKLQHSIVKRAITRIAKLPLD